MSKSLEQEIFAKATQMLFNHLDPIKGLMKIKPNDSYDPNAFVTFSIATSDDQDAIPIDLFKNNLRAAIEISIRNFNRVVLLTDPKDMTISIQDPTLYDFKKHRIESNDPQFLIAIVK